MIFGSRDGDSESVDVNDEICVCLASSKPVILLDIKHKDI